MHSKMSKYHLHRMFKSLTGESLMNMSSHENFHQVLMNWSIQT
ncbi:hypothetical protein [Pelosinus baikalensis]|nr:hypothetical protein [Pelosinus baikalensis]